jgi:acetate kinase
MSEVLALNAGSSSVKFAAYTAGASKELPESIMRGRSAPGR